MVYLQKLHQKHAKQGLVVLGYNSADKREIALDLLKKNSLTFPSVLDSSPAAQETAVGNYRTSAVPTTYVIDREGKIADAWIGYDPESDRVPKLLEKFGIKE